MSDAARSLEWVRDKCCSGLGVEPELFDELLETGGSESILQFLQGGAPWAVHARTRACRQQ